ncbi:unnamed protein product [Meloidogyne enterolobii]|uniref:Uncharacterized protein n=1 Tax=Meloidogyne enterolobii TaxID=390850 RepID=A0ACB1AT08_MELEN
MDEELQKLINNWLEWDKNENTRRQIQKLVDSNNLAELEALMIGKLSFGTAGFFKFFWIVFGEAWLHGIVDTCILVIEIF